MKNTLYEVCTTAIASYLADIECSVVKEDDSESQVDLDDVNGEYILDRLQAETDMMDEIAKRVRNAIQVVRATISPPANNAAIVRGYENGGKFD